MRQGLSKPADPYRWERLDRKTLVESKFIKVHEDTVRIPPDGNIIEDYSLVELNSPVLVIARNEHDEVLILYEYRYAHDKVMPSLPAGAIDPGETPIDAAKRELLEETGYEAETLEQIGGLHEYPTKLSHTSYVVRATGLKRVAEPKREPTEYVEATEFVRIDRIRQMIKNNEIKTAVMAAALYIALDEL